MRLTVIDGSVPRRTIPRELATDYRLRATEALTGVPRREIALVERELDDETNMVTLCELAKAPED
jgi:hypothetical protein